MPSSEMGSGAAFADVEVVEAELADPQLAQPHRRALHLAVGGVIGLAELEVLRAETEPVGIGQGEHDLRGAGVEQEGDRHAVDHRFEHEVPLRSASITDYRALLAEVARRVRAGAARLRRGRRAHRLQPGTAASAAKPMPMTTASAR